MVFSQSKMVVMKRKHHKSFNLSLLTSRQRYRLTALQLYVTIANVVDQLRSIDDDEDLSTNDMYAIHISVRCSASYRYVSDYGGVQQEERKQFIRPTFEESTSFYFDREFSHSFRMPLWAFYKLHGQVKHLPEKNEHMAWRSCPVAGPISSECRLAITLRILAGGKSAT